MASSLLSLAQDKNLQCWLGCFGFIFLQQDEMEARRPSLFVSMNIALLRYAHLFSAAGLYALWATESDKTERWGRWVKVGIQHKCYCNQNPPPPKKKFLEFLPFPVTGSLSRLLMMVETAGRIQIAFPCSYVTICVQAHTSANTIPAATNEDVTGQPVRRGTGIRNNHHRWSHSHWIHLPLWNAFFLNSWNSLDIWHLFRRHAAFIWSQLQCIFD